MSEISILAKSIPQVWVLVCPSNGWIAERHDLRTLCRTYSNIVAAKMRKLPITVLNCPSFLLDGGCDDRATDRLGQMPYTQAAFDQLGEFLAAEIKRTLLSNDAPAVRETADATEYATYLAGLNVRVNLSRPDQSNRTHIDRMLRTIAGFSLTGEKPHLSDVEIAQLAADKHCFLISVSDRLAEYGPSGFILFRQTNQGLIVDEMALSCIVLGKQAEFAILSALSRYAAEEGLARVMFAYAASDRNQPMQEFLEAVAASQPGVGYAVRVADIESRINASAVKPGAWTATLRSSLDDSGVLP
ncbi:MAG TPA: hypothetical protein VE779_01600 [Candidatus Angelobacter sp.]|nr:hypothetical protein [Candidatus Angelobacter sp.]